MKNIYKVRFRTHLLGQVLDTRQLLDRYTYDGGNNRQNN